MKIGDAFGVVATPIARGMGLDCVDPDTGELKPESPCAQRKRMLNQLGDVIWDFLWRKNGETMEQEYTVTKQIAVKASSPEEAVAKCDEGETIGLSVNRRPQPQQAIARPTTTPALSKVTA